MQLIDILSKIAKYKQEEVRKAKAQFSLNFLRKKAEEVSPAKGFIKSLRLKQAQNQWALIAEIKKTSPSKGVIRDDFKPHELAQQYEQGGSACLSVLTDTPSFDGSSSDLIEARAATNLPILRKDFMLDPYQIVEARSWGADCILLILAMIDNSLARELEATAQDYGMDVLVEIHNHEELERALKLKSLLIGINNRNLHDFTTELSVSEKLAPLVPADRLIVSESGIYHATDLQRLSEVGINTFLVGESLMRQHDAAAATAALLKKP